MSMKHDGGPAFPCGNAAHPDNPHEGMTLRDWFAGQAMRHVLNLAGGSMSEPDETGLNAHIARLSYEMADAMLEARNS